tara:strand:+ start:1737 stop:2279 length:543 start_codon:yes stop_codon:yes gene_type:complete
MVKYLLALVISFSAAAESELGVSYSRINQKLDFAQPIHFKMDAIQLSYTKYWLGGLGTEIAVARSTETPNAYFIDKHYQNKINALWSAHVVYKRPVTDRLNIKAGVGITEYHSTWRVNGVEPDWSKGTDSHKPSWFIGIQYDWHKWLTFEAGYRFQYEKTKVGYGEETTDSITSGITVRF